MSIWTKLFGRAPSPRPTATAAQVGAVAETWQSAARALLTDETNWRLVRELLDPLEAAGLRINFTLDRDLIVVRFLCGIAFCYETSDLMTFCAGDAVEGEKRSLDLRVFFDLASETDYFFGFEGINAVLPKLSTMSDEAWIDMTFEHSLSIFENVRVICIVNEHGPGDYVPQKVKELEALACGDFTIELVTETRKSDFLVGRVTLSDGQSVSFDIRKEKRPDLTSFFKAMNSLIAHLDKGRFIVVPNSGDDGFVLYLRGDEQVAFRHWAERQRYSDGYTLGDRIE